MTAPRKRRIAVLMGGPSAEREVSLVIRRRLRQGAARAGPRGDRGRRRPRPRPRRRRADRGQARRRVQRAARPLRRGRLHPGRARAARDSLYPFGRARLGARHGQADRAAGCSPRPASPAPRAASMRRAEVLGRPRHGAALRHQAAQRGLLGGRPDRVRGRQRAPVAEDWTFGELVLVETLHPGPRDPGGGDGRPRARRHRDPPQGPVLRLRGEIHRGQGRARHARADPARRPMPRRCASALPPMPRSAAAACRAPTCATTTPPGAPGAPLHARDQHPARHDAALARARDQPPMPASASPSWFHGSWRTRHARVEGSPAAARPPRAGASRPRTCARRCAGHCRSPAAATLATGGLWLHRERRRRAPRRRRRRDALLSASAGMGLHVENVLVTRPQPRASRRRRRRARRRTRHADPRLRPLRAPSGASRPCPGYAPPPSSAACPTPSISAWSSASRSPCGRRTASSP